MIEIEEPVEQSVINLDEEHKSVNNTDKKEQKKAENHMIVVVKGPSHQEVHFKVNKATKFKEVERLISLNSQQWHLFTAVSLFMEETHYLTVEFKIEI